MIKKHHPQSRAERLAIKKIKFERKKENDAGKVRASILKAQLKEQEAKDELRRTHRLGGKLEELDSFGTTEFIGSSE